MASPASSSSEGEIHEHQQKANSINQPGERTINDSSRAFGRNGASNGYGHNYYRALSRSPSPYRRARDRSPSPYRAQRSTRDPSRSPSRSPSPFRHGRSGGGPRANDSRLHNKRKASPPRGVRPDKRPHTDRSRPRDDRAGLRYEDARSSLYHSGSHTDRRSSKPLSYADTDNPPTVPDFREHLRSSERSRPNGSSQNQRRHDMKKEKQAGDVRSISQAPSLPTPEASNKSDGAPASRVNAGKELESVQAQQLSEMSLDAVEQKPAPAQETREEKLRKWAAIRAAAEKDKPKDNLLHQALLANASECTNSSMESPIASGSPNSPATSPRIGDLGSVPPSPEVMIIDKQGAISQGNSPSANSPSAADYDPTKDMLDDRDRALRKARQAEISSEAYNETDPKALSTLPAEKAAPVKKQKKDFDMFDFDEDEDDEAEDDVMEEVSDATKGTVLDEKLLDNWDDAEGYYKLIANELVNGGRYRMIKNLGRGVFANVAQAEDTSIHDEHSSHKVVAIKMIRRNDLMRKASQKEMDFVRKVNDADPQDKRHVIRLLSSFDHKGHLCAVFEHMSKNLRDLLKENTNGHGLSLQAVKSYSRQMFIGLQHLQSCQVVHCDLKPDNILVSPDLKTVKLCDFGTAVDKRDVMERTEYLVSRFYRAPEIILGLDIGYGIDMWAIGCTIYELWTGKILFTGRTNNQMIKAFMDCLGWPTEKLLKKGLLKNVLDHFEAGPPLKFVSQEVDQQGKATVRKIEQQKKISRDLRSRINDATRGMAKENMPPEKELNEFVDLLGACLNLNPEKRIQPKEALLHRFFPQPKTISRPTVVKPPMIKRPVSAFRR